uniref:Uncharacterized protein n=1 Tax=Molossus molossus TaxID=27622 RepID=A0A7J8HZW2_MOLMO|nr:hypothetical protein HJG59_010808 [Molossus molossus]
MAASGESDFLQDGVGLQKYVTTSAQHFFPWAPSCCCAFAHHEPQPGIRSHSLCPSLKTLERDMLCELLLDTFRRHSALCSLYSPECCLYYLTLISFCPILSTALYLPISL